MNLINLKLNFFTKLNHLKVAFLILHRKTQETREHIITFLLDNITFLKDQLRQKDKRFINQTIFTTK